MKHVFLSLLAVISSLSAAEICSDSLGNAAIAVAGPDVVCIAGDTVTLDGSASTDATAWRWSLVEAPQGNEANLAVVTSPVVSFTPQIAGKYRFELVVSDGANESAPAECTVTVDRVRIVSSAGRGGSIEPQGEKVYLAGSQPAYTATADAGYRFDAFRVDGSTVRSEHYAFESLDRNHDIEAVFAAIPYAITYTELKGSENPNPATYTVEDEIVFAALPDVEGSMFFNKPR